MAAGEARALAGALTEAAERLEQLPAPADEREANRRALPVRATTALVERGERIVRLQRDDDSSWSREYVVRATESGRYRWWEAFELDGTAVPAEEPYTLANGKQLYPPLSATTLTQLVSCLQARAAGE